MAYGAGDNIFNYCHVVFKKYKEDNLIFVKAIQTILFFQSRVDFPFCFNDLNNAIKRILGDDLLGIALHSGKYLFGHDDMKWDLKNTYSEATESTLNLEEGLTDEQIEKIVPKFKNEFEAFYLTAKPIIELSYSSKLNPSGLKNISIQKDDKSKTRTIRFIRTDNAYLDINVNLYEIDFLIRTLSNEKKTLDDMAGNKNDV